MHVVTWLNFHIALIELLVLRRWLGSPCSSVDEQTFDLLSWLTDVRLNGGHLQAYWTSLVVLKLVAPVMSLISHLPGSIWAGRCR